MNTKEECVFPRAYSLTGGYQVEINLSFLGSSHSLLVLSLAQGTAFKSLCTKHLQSLICQVRLLLNPRLGLRDADLLVNNSLQMCLFVSERDVETVRKVLSVFQVAQCFGKSRNASLQQSQRLRQIK